MGKKKFKIKPKTWPKEYTFEEFQRLNPNINESLLINYYHKYLQEYSENYSRHIKHFNDNKKLLSNNLQEVKKKYKNSQYFLDMSYSSYINSATQGGINPKPFTPTDIQGLTHWFKVEPQYITSEPTTYNATSDIQEIISWSNAVDQTALVDDTRSGNKGSGQLTYNHDSVGFFRGKTYTQGNTGGHRMVLTDSPSFGTFTYFAVLSLNQLDTAIGMRSGTGYEATATGSVVFTNAVGDAEATDRTILIKHSETTTENYRLIFSSDLLSGSNAPDYENYFSEQVITASISPYMSAGEITDKKVSGSTLAKSLTEVINTLPQFVAVSQSTTTRFFKYPEISKYTGLPHDGNYYNVYGDSSPIEISKNWPNTHIVQSAGHTSGYHGLWAGETINTTAVNTTDNTMLLWSVPTTITSSIDLRFLLAASSSIDTGDNTGAVAHLTNDPKHNQKFVFMVTKDAPENALLKAYINNVSSFEDPNPTGSLELDEMAHFEPKFFGLYNGQSRTLNGNVYEMGFFTGSLSENDRTQLYNYLGSKHNIPGYNGPSVLKPYNYPQ